MRRHSSLLTCLPCSGARTHRLGDQAPLTAGLLRVDGGAAVNDLLMPFQANVLGVTISRPAIIETTALGAAFLAGLGAGVWTSKQEIVRAWREEQRFTPTAERSSVDEHLRRWAAAIAKA